MGTWRLGHRALALLLFLVSPVLSADLQPTVITDFTPGLHTTKDPTQIPDGAAQDLQNVDVWKGRIEKRRGSVLQNSTTLGGLSGHAVRLLHEYPDASGNFWLISASSETIYKSNDGGATNSVLTSTHGFTTESEYSAVNAFGKVRLTDGTTNWITFDGSLVGVSTASPKGETAAFFGERIWTSIDSILYASAFGDPEDWTDDGISDDDSWSENIREDDGYSIQAIVRFQNGVIVFKPFSMDFVTLPDGINPVVTPISSVIGTQHPKSIQVVENTMYFLGQDAFYAFDGVRFARISDNIEPTVGEIAQLDSASRSYTETSQAQFQAGISTGVTPNFTAGEIHLSTWTATDTSASDFAAGTLTNTTTNTVSGAVYLSTNNTNVTNNGFESGTTADADNWDGDGGGASPWRRESNQAQAGTWSMEADGSGYRFSILDSNGVGLSTASYTATDGAWTQRSQSLSAYAGTHIKIRLTDGTSGGGSSVTTDAVFFCSGGDVTWYDRYSLADDFVFIDTIEGGRSTTYSGTFLSQTFDTALSSPAWLATGANFSANGHSISFETQVATATDGTFDSLVSWSTGSAPTSSNKRFARYKISISTASGGTALPFVSDVSLAARSLSGRYMSSVINIGSDISAWGQFTGTKNNDGGSQTFEIYTDTDTASGITATDATTFTSSQTITSGSIPTISTAAFAYVGSTHSITAATQDPSMSDFSIGWNEGGANFPVTSVSFEGDYISAVAISSATGNDKMLVFDSNGAWTIYDGLPAYSMSLYRQKPYFGSNLTGKIYRFQADGVLNDDGTAIDSYWESKEFDFGSILTDKFMKKYYVTGEYASGSDATFSFGVNRSTVTTSTTLDLDSVSGYFRKTIVPATNTTRIGASHRFKISDSDASQTFSIIGVAAYPRLETDPGP